MREERGERERDREREIGAEHAVGVIRALGIRGKLVGGSGEYGPMSEDGDEIPRLRINDGMNFFFFFFCACVQSNL